ncbi:MAG: hypothetical protein JWM47_4530 [Acidimicrobiales bacterium]|nr:hypothetical protein [Acidimicrobiales bacterium]
MSNVFLKAERIVAQGLGLLQRELVLPRLVQRFGQSDFVGAKDDTINVRVPAILQAREYEWRTRTSPIVVDELEELSIPVSLDTHIYSAIGVTDEELTLDIADWGAQVATPQIRAVAEKLEASVANVMANANFAHSVEYAPPASPDGDDLSFYAALVGAKKELDLENVPLAGRIVLLGANVAAAALLSPHLVKVNEAGGDSALRDASLGRIAGFDIYTSNSIDADFAVAFHPTAFAFANVAPVVPSGARGATDAYAGLAMRWIRDYDSDYLRDRSVYSSFAGAASVEDGRDLAPGSGYGGLTGENVRAVEIEFTAP